MDHLDDGTLLSLLDGELTAEDRTGATDHLASCAPCRGRREALEVERRLVAEALAAADVAPPSTAAAADVAARAARAGGPASAGPRSWLRSPLARAAGLVLAFAAAASAAVPGSPVREWLFGPEPPVEPAAAAPAESEASAPPPEPRPEAGVLVDAFDGGLRVSVSGLPPGAQVQVKLVDDARTGVYAPEGARFQTAPGSVEAHVDGAWVRIELSRTLSSALIEVDGQPYLRKSGQRLELSGPARDSTGAEIRFQVPEEGAGDATGGTGPGG